MVQSTNMSKRNGEKAKLESKESKVKIKKLKKESDESEEPDVPRNSESRIILFGLTVMEWQKEYQKPAEFNSITDKSSLTQAIKAQFRDFKADVKPKQYQLIYTK